MKPSVTFYLPLPYKKALQEMAAAQKITLGNAIRQALASYLCTVPNDSPPSLARVQRVNNKDKGATLM